MCQWHGPSFYVRRIAFQKPRLFFKLLQVRCNAYLLTMKRTRLYPGSEPVQLQGSSRGLRVQRQNQPVWNQKKKTSASYVIIKWVTTLFRHRPYISGVVLWRNHMSTKWFIPSQKNWKVADSHQVQSSHFHG